MGWMTIKGIGVWGDLPQDAVGAALSRILKRLPKRLSINDISRIKKSLLANSELKSKMDREYMREWGRPMNTREFSFHIDKGLSAAFCSPELYGGKKNPLGLVGAGLLSGIGLGVGFATVNWGKKKLLQKNPGEGMIPDAMETAIGMGVGYALSGKKIKRLKNARRRLR